MSDENESLAYENRVRDRAHQLWENAGRPDGKEMDHWKQAEDEILAEIAEASPPQILDDRTKSTKDKPESAD